MNNQEEKEFIGDLAVLLDQVRDFYEKWQNRPGLGVLISVSDDECEGFYMRSETAQGLKNSIEQIKNAKAYRWYKWKTKKMNVAAALLD